MKLLLQSMALLLLLAPYDPALAWGGDGHKIVCAIAHKLLPAEQQREVDRLAELYVAPDGWQHRYFTAGCGFADVARGKARDGAHGWERFRRYSRWHFMNLDRTDREFDRGDCAGNCVLTGIEFHLARLRDSSLDDQARAEALLFLGHWVADVHQPLHVGYGDDRGGSDIDRIESDLYDSRHLHQVWDSGIVARTLGRTHFWDYAGELKRRIPADERRAWEASPPEVWAAESYEIATREHVGYCLWRGDSCHGCGATRHIGAGYQERFAPVVERRLQQAGVRLAALLEAALAPRRF